MEELKIRDIMTTELVTIEEHDTLEMAEQMMEAGRIHHLPVLCEGRLTGLVTHADLLRAQVSSLAEPSQDEERAIKQSIPVSMVMSRSVATVSSNDSARKAAQTLRKHKFGCLPVLDGNRLVGIVTEGDFVDLVIRALADDNPARISLPPRPNAPAANGPAASATPSNGGPRPRHPRSSAL